MAHKSLPDNGNWDVRNASTFGSDTEEWSPKSDSMFRESWKRDKKYGASEPSKRSRWRPRNNMNLKSFVLSPRWKFLPKNDDNNSILVAEEKLDHLINLLRKHLSIPVIARDRDPKMRFDQFVLQPLMTKSEHNVFMAYPAKKTEEEIPKEDEIPCEPSVTNEVLTPTCDSNGGLMSADQIIDMLVIPAVDPARDSTPAKPKREVFGYISRSRHNATRKIVDLEGAVSQEVIQAGRMDKDRALTKLITTTDPVEKLHLLTSILNKSSYDDSWTFDHGAIAQLSSSCRSNLRASMFIEALIQATESIHMAGSLPAFSLSHCLLACLLFYASAQDINDHFGSMRREIPQLIKQIHAANIHQSTFDAYMEAVDNNLSDSMFRNLFVSFGTEMKVEQAYPISIYFAETDTQVSTSEDYLARILETVEDLAEVLYNNPVVCILVTKYFAALPLGHPETAVFYNVLVDILRMLYQDVSMHSSVVTPGLLLEVEDMKWHAIILFKLVTKRVIKSKHESALFARAITEEAKAHQMSVYIRDLLRILCK